jgi:glycosyltransferase involved in cell wall biosynthesis
MELSLVIPVLDEEDNIKPLYEAIEQSLSSVKSEIIFVDDGSKDESVKRIKSLKAHKNHNIKIIEFNRNFGQTAAMSAGIDEASGKYIAFLDADLQNDPADIPNMLDYIKDNEFDIVAGKRADRKDKFLSRKLPSLLANKLLYGISKVKVSDYGCSLKILKKQVAKDLDLYGDMHRFIPILASLNGAKIGEVDVNHKARKFGESKYGMSRTLKVMSDILLMAFFIRYKQKPMHLFGGLGIFSLSIGAIIEFYLLMLKFAGEDIGTRPLFYTGILLILVGLQFITTGFLAELLLRNYYKNNKEKPYKIRKKTEVK